MKKCIVIPDSFKGTMDAEEVCGIMERSLLSRCPDCEVVSIPVADGGEGTVDCFLRCMDGKKVYVRVKNAFGEETDGFYGRFSGTAAGDTAVIEMAAVAGMVSNDELGPMTASTYGVGQLIRHAVTAGCRKIILGLGGSCTNDAGAGMASAVGTVFYDDKGERFVPDGGSLSRIRAIDNAPAARFMAGVEVTCMCDVQNVLYGLSGAAYVFAPQKGADRDQVKILDDNLRAFARIVQKEMDIDVSQIPSGGAAGGMGAGAYAFLGAGLTAGIDLVLDTVDFERMLEDCDVVFTGEGRFDAQSLNGKVVVGVAGRAKKHNVPVVVIAGSVDDNAADGILAGLGISRVYAMADKDAPLESVKKTCRDDLKRVMGRALDQMDIGGLWIR